MRKTNRRPYKCAENCQDSLNVQIAIEVVFRCALQPHVYKRQLEIKENFALFSFSVSSMDPIST